MPLTEQDIDALECDECDAIEVPDLLEFLGVVWAICSHCNEAIGVISTGKYPVINDPETRM